VQSLGSVMTPTRCTAPNSSVVQPRWVSTFSLMKRISELRQTPWSAPEMPVVAEDTTASMTSAFRAGVASPTAIATVSVLDSAT
jgi:hypothetical protein